MTIYDVIALKDGERVVAGVVQITEDGMQYRTDWPDLAEALKEIQERGHVPYRYGFRTETILCALTVRPVQPGDPEYPSALDEELSWSHSVSVLGLEERV